jgi:hypothetical protein
MPFAYRKQYAKTSPPDLFMEQKGRKPGDEGIFAECKSKI